MDIRKHNKLMSNSFELEATNKDLAIFACIAVNNDGIPSLLHDGSFKNLQISELLMIMSEAFLKNGGIIKLN